MRFLWPTKLFCAYPALPAAVPQQRLIQAQKCHEGTQFFMLQVRKQDANGDPPRPQQEMATKPLLASKLGHPGRAQTPLHVYVWCACVSPLALALSRSRSLLGTYLLGK